MRKIYLVIIALLASLVSPPAQTQKQESCTLIPEKRKLICSEDRHTISPDYPGTYSCSDLNGDGIEEILLQCNSKMNFYGNILYLLKVEGKQTKTLHKEGLIEDIEILPHKTKGYRDIMLFYRPDYSKVRAPPSVICWNGKKYQEEEAGKYFFRKRKYEKAIDLWDEELNAPLYSEDPNEPGHSPEKKAELLNNIGLAHYKLSDYERAIENLEKAIKNLEKANLEGEVEIEKAKEIEKKAYFNLGNVYEKIGDCSGAIKAWQGFLERGACDKQRREVEGRMKGCQRGLRKE